MLHRALLAAVALASLSAGCIYIPPVHDTAGIKSVRRVEPGVTTRADLLERLGPPQVLAKQSVYVYDWDQSYGYVLFGAGYSGGGAKLKGKHFHAVVYFDADRVARYEWDSDPPLEPEHAKPRFVPAPVSGPQALVLPGAGDAESTCAAFSTDLARCLVAFDSAGSVWVVARGRDAGRLKTPWKTRPGIPPWERQMISPDDRLLAAGTSTALEVWDVAALEAEQHLQPKPLATTDDGPAAALLALAIFPAADAGAPAIAFSPDGALVAAGAGRRVLVTTAQGESQIWLEVPAGVTGRPSFPSDFWTASGPVWNVPPAVERVRFSADRQKVIVLFGTELLAFEIAPPG